MQDFTFVCPTEIIAFSDRAEEFKDLNCDLIAASTDTEEVRYDAFQFQQHLQMSHVLN